METAHRVVAQRSRAMMLGAPHLPKWVWALADKYAIYVGRLLPQSTRGWKSSYFLNRKLAPDWRNMAIHVFGSPCVYAPVEGPVHKRASRTEEGYFIGVQHPMCLVIRKSDMKLIYTAPLSLPASELGPAILKEPVNEIHEAEDDGSAKLDRVNPTHVQSIKSVSAHTVPPPNTSGPSLFRKPSTLDASAETQSPNPGEGVVVPEHNAYDADLELGLAAMKEKVATRIADPGIRQRVINSLQSIDDTLAGVNKKGALKIGKQSHGNVSASNVIEGKRSRQHREIPIKEIDPQPKKKKVKMVIPSKFQVGDSVSAMAEIFDGDRPGSYSKKHPGKAFGVIVKTGSKRNVVQVK